MTSMDSGSELQKKISFFGENITCKQVARSTVKHIVTQARTNVQETRASGIKNGTESLLVSSKTGKATMTNHGEMSIFTFQNKNGCNVSRMSPTWSLKDTDDTSSAVISPIVEDSKSTDVNKSALLFNSIESHLQADVEEKLFGIIDVEISDPNKTLPQNDIDEVKMDNSTTLSAPAITVSDSSVSGSYSSIPTVLQSIPDHVFTSASFKISPAQTVELRETHQSESTTTPLQQIPAPMHFTFSEVDTGISTTTNDAIESAPNKADLEIQDTTTDTAPTPTHADSSSVRPSNVINDAVTTSGEEDVDKLMSTSDFRHIDILKIKAKQAGAAAIIASKMRTFNLQKAYKSQRYALEQNALAAARVAKVEADKKASMTAALIKSTRLHNHALLYFIHTVRYGYYQVLDVFIPHNVKHNNHANNTIQDDYSALLNCMRDNAINTADALALEHEGKPKLTITINGDNENAGEEDLRDENEPISNPQDHNAHIDDHVKTALCSVLNKQLTAGNKRYKQITRKCEVSYDTVHTALQSMIGVYLLYAQCAHRDFMDNDSETNHHNTYNNHPHHTAIATMHSNGKHHPPSPHIVQHDRKFSTYTKDYVASATLHRRVGMHVPTPHDMHTNPNAMHGHGNNQVGVMDSGAELLHFNHHTLKSVDEANTANANHKQNRHLKFVDTLKEFTVDYLIKQIKIDYANKHHVSLTKDEVPLIGRFAAPLNRTVREKEKQKQQQQPSVSPNNNNNNNNTNNKLTTTGTASMTVIIPELEHHQTHMHTHKTVNIIAANAQHTQHQITNMIHKINRVLSDYDLSIIRYIESYNVVQTASALFEKYLRKKLQRIEILSLQLQPPPLLRRDYDFDSECGDMNNVHKYGKETVNTQQIQALTTENMLKHNNSNSNLISTIAILDDEEITLSNENDALNNKFHATDETPRGVNFQIDDLELDSRPGNRKLSRNKSEASLFVRKAKQDKKIKVDYHKKAVRQSNALTYFIDKFDRHRDASQPVMHHLHLAQLQKELKLRTYSANYSPIDTTVPHYLNKNNNHSISVNILTTEPTLIAAQQAGVNTHTVKPSFLKKSVTEIRAALRRGVVVPMESPVNKIEKDFEDYDIFAPPSLERNESSGIIDHNEWPLFGAKPTPYALTPTTMNIYNDSSPSKSCKIKPLPTLGKKKKKKGLKKKIQSLFGVAKTGSREGGTEGLPEDFALLHGLEEEATTRTIKSNAQSGDNSVSVLTMPTPMPHTHELPPVVAATETPLITTQVVDSHRTDNTADNDLMCSDEIVYNQETTLLWSGQNIISPPSESPPPPSLLPPQAQQYQELQQQSSMEKSKVRKPSPLKRKNTEREKRAFSTAISLPDQFGNVSNKYTVTVSRYTIRVLKQQFNVIVDNVVVASHTGSPVPNIATVFDKTALPHDCDVAITEIGTVISGIGTGDTTSAMPIYESDFLNFYFKKTFTNFENDYVPCQSKLASEVLLFQSHWQKEFAANQRDLQVYLNGLKTLTVQQIVTQYNAHVSDHCTSVEAHIDCLLIILVKAMHNDRYKKQGKLQVPIETILNPRNKHTSSNTVTVKPIHANSADYINTAQHAQLFAATLTATLTNTNNTATEIVVPKPMHPICTLLEKLPQSFIPLDNNIEKLLYLLINVRDEYLSCCNDLTYIQLAHVLLVEYFLRFVKEHHLPHYEQLKTALTPSSLTVATSMTESMSSTSISSINKHRPSSPLRVISPVAATTTTLQSVPEHLLQQQQQQQQKQKLHGAHTTPVLTVEEIELIKLKKTLKFFQRRTEKLNAATAKNVKRAKEINELR